MDEPTKSTINGGDGGAHDDDEDAGSEQGSAGEIEAARCIVGPGGCAPRPLQRCASIGPFTANVSGLFFVNVAFFTYYVGTIRTLEKRFNMSSTKSGFTLMLMDVMFALLSLVIGYLGRRSHKPRVMVVCQLLTSVGIFILALPVVVYGPHKPEIEPTTAFNTWSSGEVQRMPSEAEVNRMIGLCVPPADDILNTSYSAQARTGGACADGAAADAAAQASEESQRAYILLLSGSLLIGLGGVAVSNLGIPYIDENVVQSESACFIGAATSAYSWAPIVGLLLSALCTRIPETLTDKTGLKPSHPSYVGAWWLGMVILGTLSLGLTVPMAMFPKHLRHYYVNRRQQRQNDMEAPAENGLGSHLKEFWRLTAKFLTNGPYVALLLSKICGLYGVTGVILQLPRYMEIHYRQPAYIASIIAAFSGGIVGALGTVLGGFVLRRLKLETRGVAFLFTMATAFGALGTGVCMLYGCPQVDLHGQWDQANGRLSVGSECSSQCGCSETMFVPVCTDDGQTYFSPCHAGCRGALLKNNTFQDCDCVGPGVGATRGYCGEDTCRTMIPYIITFIVVSFLVTFGRVPATILMFRLVDEKEKAPVMGLTSFFVNILCFVPAPLLFGALFDSACLVWKSSCGADKGACLVYDTRRFRLLMHGVTLAFQIPSLIFAGITLYLVRNRTNSKTKEAMALDNKSNNPLIVSNCANKNTEIDVK